MEDNKWMDERVKPFNQFYLGSCFKEAYLPAFCALGGSDVSFLLNNVIYFEFTEEKLSIRSSYIYDSIELEKQCDLASQFYIEEKKNIVETILESLKLGRLCICRADNPIAFDPEKGKNAAGSGDGVIHWLLLYGYDLEMKQFHVLEHRTNFSALYQPMLISFQELERTYTASFRPGEEERSYFEIWKEGKQSVADFADERRILFQKRKEWLKEYAPTSLDALIQFYEYLEQCQLDVKASKLLKNINDIIMFFRQESYIFADLIEDAFFEEIIKYNNLLRSYALKKMTGKEIRKERYVSYCSILKECIQKYKERNYEILSN